MEGYLEKEPLNIIITGVGGQGNVLASQVVAVAAVGAGFKVAVGETFGVSQRGGSVMSHVRLSRHKAVGPLIPRGRAALIAGLEPLETLRVALDYAGTGAVVIMNDRPNYPLGCLLEEDRYPEMNDIMEDIRNVTHRIHVLPAMELAAGLGSPLAANMVLTGALAVLLPFGREHFINTVQALFTDPLRQLNTRAFDLGFQRLSGCLRESSGTG